MRVGINSPDIARHTGYGRAACELMDALEQAGVEVCNEADTMINFCMPKDYVYGKITIGYTPWESTELPKGWVDHLKRVDDLWTTSKWTAEVFRQHTGRNAFVLNHGINETWIPHRHEEGSRPFTFLHIGEPAVRKGGDVVLEAWHRAFRKSDCRLILKSTGIPMGRVKDRGGSIIYSPLTLEQENGQIINQVYSDYEMADLFDKVDCLVYPTRGEGFGFIPLEAMACGLPTILPSGGGTAEFSELGYPLTHFVWRDSAFTEHPGLIMDHSVDEVIDMMRFVKDHYEYCSKLSYENAYILRDMFSWEDIAQKFILRLEAVQEGRYTREL